MLKRSFGVGLLCLAHHAYSAPIKVTTTEDVASTVNQCSLRHAIEYVNLGMPEEAYKGCGGKDAENIILLKANTEYTLQKQIKISKRLVMRTDYGDVVSDSVMGKNNAIIKMKGKDRIFWIERAPPEKPAEGEEPAAPQAILVTLVELTLDGCQADACVDQGGLIYNKDNLSFQFGQLINGRAKQGGAIYNYSSEVKDAPKSSIIILDTLLKGNKANEGAVIYSERPQFYVFKSLIRENEVLNANASNFQVQRPFKTAEEMEDLGPALVRGLVNSTIYNNKGYITTIHDGMLMNNVTMVFNTKGLIFNAPLKKGNVSNNIIAKNGNLDCQVIAGADAKKISNNLYGTGCEGELGQTLGTTRLIAGEKNEGKCDLNSDGIMCPINDYTEHALGFFKPRLLSSYKQIADSPIVNHGPYFGSEMMSCVESQLGDQRGRIRPTEPSLCDRGSIELAFNTTDVNLIGADIFYGGIAKMQLTDQLVDGELVDAKQCKALFGDRPDGQAWQPGCMRIEQNLTPSKGTTTISPEGEVTYTPNGNWHGSDDFKILVVTTTTRFNDSNNPYIQIPVRIVQSPPNDFQNKKTGGSLGVWTFMGLVGLIGLRLRKSVLDAAKLGNTHEK
ncbi:rhombotarget A family protein [Acinetobacter calcoaceticus]|uniref:Rhombotarget A family protein n=1 Tax=Acinetobacter calcoaceticus TaxID=471 RepID=A0A4R1XTR2_ACICA|nr:rhombotarget A family protein [Acinetobacter calcoaceticus]